MAKKNILSQLVPGIVPFVVGAIAAAIVQDALKESVLQSERALLLVLMLCLLSLAFTLRKVLGKLNSRTNSLEGVIERGTNQVLVRLEGLDGQLGLKVRYIERNKGQANLFIELRRIMEQATKSIIAVNTFLPERSLPKTDPENDLESTNERRLYFDSILKRATEGRVLYKRLVQVEQEHTFQEMMRDYEYGRHFRQALDVRESNKHLVSLIKARPRRPITFVLVDDRWLMVQMDERFPYGQIHMHGFLMFDDPQQIIVRYFRDFCVAIGNDPLGSIGRSDLPELGSAPDPLSPNPESQADA